MKMKSKRFFQYTATFVLTLIFILTPQSIAQKKQQKSPGGYHG
jgi:hypothetical protein